MNSNYYCPGDPTIFGVFDLQYAPALIFYAYIPIIIVALFFGVYVFIKDRRSLQSKLILTISILFAFWNLDILGEWTAVPINLNIFLWQLTMLFEMPIALCAVYLAYAFLEKSDIKFYLKMLLFILCIPVFIFLPSPINVGIYDVLNCQPELGWLTYYVYGFEILSILWIIAIAIKKYIATDDRVFKRQIVLMISGICLFLLTFSLSNIFGELVQVYQINLFGPLGMVVFLGLMTYMIVRYQAFNIKLFATQALVAGIAVLIGARMFYSTTMIGTVLSVVTLIGFLISGVFLIRSVKKEIAQRELLEVLTQQLGETNSRQETLLHFIGHEVKGTLAKDEGVFAAISEGDLGPVSETVKAFTERALAESRHGAASVENILKASNLKKGTVTYTKAPFDLKELVSESVKTEKHIAEAKGLALSFTADDASYQMTGDKAQISSHVLRNIIDNAINYTPTGSIEVSIKRDGSKIIFAVKDSGVGISDDDKERLFTEGGHGKDSQRVNVHSTGYGLYIAKQIVLEHGGTVRAESEGAGKGATFTVEFPAT